MRFADLLYRCCAGLAALAVAGQLAAEPLFLPNELPMAALPISIELSNADLLVSVRADSEHLLRARVAFPSPDAEPAPVALDVSLEGDYLSIRRLEEADGDGNGELPRLVIDLIVVVGQPVTLEGSELEIRVDDPTRKTVTKGKAGGSASELSPSLFRFALTNSQADLSGVQSPVFDLAASALWLDGTGGTLSLTLQGGSAEIAEHSGPVTLEATDAEVVFSRLAGRLTTRLKGGRLDLVDSRGNIQGHATDAVVVFENWRGTVELVGEASVLEARSDLSVTSEWQLEGRDLEVFFERIQGTITTTLDGGSLRSDQLRATLTVEAGAGARLDIVDLQGQVSVQLTGGAQAQLSGIRGLLAAKVTDARLEVDGVDKLQLEPTRAEIVARRVAHLAPLKATDSGMMLDLLEIQNHPFVKLLGSGLTRVQLPIPCVVRMADPETVVNAAIEVTGCELRLPRQRVSERLKYGADPPTRLTVRLDPGVELEVEGEP